MEKSSIGMRGWPALDYEPHQWTPRADGVSRRAFLAHSGPYRAAITPSIAGATLSLPSAVQSLAEEASAELARVDATLRASRIGPLPAVLLRTESASSSQIERLTASAKSLAEAEIGERSGANARLVLANVRAMERALAFNGAISLESILAVHSTLIEPDPLHAPGLRAEQVWVGGTTIGPHRADFVPPHHDRVPAAMADLVSFVGRTDIPVIAHLALAHAQFETIHPFTDGNGRTGRALLHMMLKESGLTRGSTIPVSAGLLHETDAYFAALTAYREGDIEPIIERVADAAIFASGRTLDLNGRLQALADDWRERVRARKGASAWRLAEILPARPVVTYEVVQGALGVAAPTAYAAIDALAEAGVLVPRSATKRNRVWDAVDVLAALDEFAEEARRG
jgi:Fic family protein